MRRAAAASMVAAVAGVVVVVVACGGSSYIYPARQFNRTLGCLDPITGIDVIDGTDPGGLCPIVCLVSKDLDGGTSVYATSECEPYPPLFDTSGTDPDCPRAIAAYQNGPSCLSDGGVSEGGVVDGTADGTADAPTADGAPDSAPVEGGEAVDTGADAPPDDGGADASDAKG